MLKNPAKEPIRKLAPKKADITYNGSPISSGDGAITCLMNKVQNPHIHKELIKGIRIDAAIMKNNLWLLLISFAF